MKKIFAGASLFALPMVTFAAVSNAEDLINLVGSLLNKVVPLIFALAFVYLLWNIFKYIESGAGDVKARDTARDAIIFALVLLFVMSSVWGLVSVIKNTFQVSGGGVQVPTINVTPGTTLQ